MTRIAALHDWLCLKLRLSHAHSLCPSQPTIVLDRAYRIALSVVEIELRDLLTRSVELIGVLDEIDERLRTVLSLVRAEEADMNLEKEELLGHMWTILDSISDSSYILSAAPGRFRVLDPTLYWHGIMWQPHIRVFMTCKAILNSCGKQGMRAQTAGG